MHTFKISAAAAVLLVITATFLTCENGSPQKSVVDDSLGLNDTVPKDTLPADTLPPDTVPTDTVPTDTVPTDTVPTDTVPTDTVPTDTVPTDTVPTDTVPTDTVPTDTVPTDTVPTDTVPTDTVPTDTVPTDTVSTDTVSTDTIPKENEGLTVYFIRHAETVANASGEIGGGGDMEDHDSLTELGTRQIEALKDFLVEERIVPDLIAVSPAYRCQKTIEPFLIAADLTAEIWVELNECCGQEPTGEPLPTERPEQRWKMEIDIVAENTVFRDEEDNGYWWPGTYEEGLFMVMTARDRLLERYGRSGKTVMIVGHAVNGGILLGLLTGYDMITEEPERPFWLFNTGIIQLEQDPRTGEIEAVDQRVNDPPRE